MNSLTMKRLIIFIFATLVSGMSFSQDLQPASQDSIEKLFEVAEVKQMHDASMKEMTEMVEQSAERLMDRVPLKYQENFRQSTRQLDAMVKEELSWENIKPQYISAYSELFTQQEIDDLIAFCQTPSGKSFIRKYPLFQQKISAISQEKTMNIVERFSKTVLQTTKSHKYAY